MTAYDFPMLANLLHFLHRRRTAEDYDDAFVQGVNVRGSREPRSRKSERVLIAGWILIGMKCAAVWWCIHAYAMPVNPWWIIAPTLLAAGVCTWLYLRRP